MRKRRSTPKAKKNDLDPVWIPNIAKPIPGDTEVDGGLGIWWKNHDLDVFVKMLAVAPMQTFLQLFWGSDKVPVAHAFIGEHNQHLDYIPLTVKSHWILPEYADPVYCRFTTPSNHISRTRPLRLRVKHDQPGGRDPNHEQDGHQGLNFDLPPDVKIDGVHPGNVGPGKGVNIVIHPYLHMSLFDTIRLAWGSQLIEYQIVKPSEVGDSVVITVDYQTIVKAGDDPMLKVAFQVKDAVDNYPDYYALWSAVELVNVSLGFELHDRPWLGDVGDPEFEIHLAILGDNDQKVSMYPSRADFELKDSVLMVFEGRDADNMIVSHTELWEVDKVGAAHGFYIPNGVVRAVALGTATIFYEHDARSGGIRLSQRLQVKIIGDRPSWAAPTVDEAPAGYLNPDAAQATVRFTAAPGWQPDYDLRLVIVTTHTDNQVHYQQIRKVGNLGPAPHTIVMTVPGFEIKPFKGHAVVVYYELTVPDVMPPRESERLPLLVGEFVGDMPLAIVEGAEGGWLNPSDVPDGPRVTLPVDDTKMGDQLILYWSVSDDGLSKQFPVSVSADGERPETVVPAEYIAPNLNKSVTVYYTLARAGETLRYSQTLTLFIGVLPLAIDPRLMVLNGQAFKINWPTTGVDAPGNTQVRFAVGGYPPYTYSSTAPAVASAVAGKVTGNANGLARIQVTDQKGTSVGFDVEVTNVYRLVINEAPMTSAESVAWMRSIGGVTSYNDSLLRVLPIVYNVPVRTDFKWACHIAGRWGIFLQRSSLSVAGATWVNQKLGAWCLIYT